MLKQYLNNLPDPVIPYATYPTVIELAKSFHNSAYGLLLVGNATLAEYKDLIAQIPTAHKNCFLYLINFLNTVTFTFVNNAFPKKIGFKA